MFATVNAAYIEGLNVHFVRVETDMSDGLPGLYLIGYLGSEVREAGTRVRTAMHHIGMQLPNMRTVVNLAPADRLKRGTQFDLAIAVTLACAMGQIKKQELEDTLVVGELSLNGRINAIPGVLLIARHARENGFKRLLLPLANLEEGRLVPGIEIIGVAALEDAFACLSGTRPIYSPARQIPVAEPDYPVDFSDVRGQESVRRGALIAAAGYHNFMMIGPPGAGKTMIAKRMPTIMPPMLHEECMELTEIYSVAGLLRGKGLMTGRPFRAPHHTVTPAALIGGADWSRPGEITLAHHGILFLDEFAEFPRHNLELLRQPLEEHTVNISKARINYSYPADFLLVAAMNPCPCGYYPDLSRCRCSDGIIQRYRNKISGPLLDRMDLCVRIEEIGYEALRSDGQEDLSSAQMAERVLRAHQMQKRRYAGESYHYNGRIPGRDIKRWCVLSDTDTKFMEQAYQKLHLSARSYHRILRVARTIADLAESEKIETPHLLEAIGYRGSGVMNG